MKQSRDPVPLEVSLWDTADRLRNSVDPSDYKHFVLALVFLRYASALFSRHHELLSQSIEASSRSGHPDSGLSAQLLESPGSYRGQPDVFWVPPDSRWEAILGARANRNIASVIDSAINSIAVENAALSGLVSPGFERLDANVTCELVTAVDQIDFSVGAPRDVLGRVYEYFLGRFAAAEGIGGGQFYTPESVVRLLVEMIEPLSGRVYDPCCGTGGMFVMSERLVRAHGGKRDDITIYGQEMNAATWRLALMNLAIHGVKGDLGPRPADTFVEDLQRDLRADYILANPPFNVSYWKAELLQQDERWRYGTPPIGNANFAWIQHIIHHLSPTGTAGFVLANGALSSGRTEAEIRRRIVEEDLLDCVVALPPQLFYSTQIAASLWFLAKTKRRNHDRSGMTLFVDARSFGMAVDRTHRELEDAELRRIVATYHAWRDGRDYEDIVGYCASETILDIAAHRFALVPGRYCGPRPHESRALDAEMVSDALSGAERRFARAAHAGEQAVAILRRLGRD